MNGLMAVALDSRGVVAVSGPMAREFLQGLVTTDVDSLEPGHAVNAALLTPQGKILFEFIVFAAEKDRFLLDTWGAASADLAKRLMFYRLRAKVEIEALTDRRVLAFWGGSTPPDVDGVFADPRLDALGWRAIVASGDAEAAMEHCEPVSEDAYQAHRIGLGVAEFGIDYPTSDAFPHEADLDQLGGIDFEKGCYVGQEVVSRMQHRGTARSRFVPVEIDGAAPAAGTPVEADGKVVGSMGSAAGNRGLARLRLDRVGDAIEGATPIRAGEAVLRLVRPDWATFQWPGDRPAGGS